MKYRYLLSMFMFGFFLVFSQVAQAVPLNFQNELLITNLNEPVALEFLPDNRMLVVGRLGNIWVSQPNSGYTQLDPTPFLQLTNISNNWNENGVFSIALDPNFTQNGHYYVFYTAQSPQIRDRVSRFTAVGNTTDPATEVIIWQDIADPGITHHGGSLGFGPDGYLYFSVGEHFIASNAQRLDTPRGKILRIAKDGSIPTTNPFYDGPGPNVDAIWAYGLRNPFRMSFDTLTGKLYIADVGQNDQEEINLGSGGLNYGWPLCEGICGISGMTNPIHSYSHNSSNSSVTGGFVYRGNQFPSSYYGSYFFGDYAKNWIKRLTFDINGNVSSVENFEPENGSAFGPYGNITDLKQGPDGALYYVDYNYSVSGGATPGGIRRIRYTASNQPPVVSVSADSQNGMAPLTVNFSSIGTFDPEGQTLTYSWNFGDQTTSTSPNPIHAYTANGQYVARLSVSDGTNTSLSNPLTITVGNRPQPNIISPLTNSTFQAGDIINFSGSATDVEDVTIPDSNLSWNVVFRHEGHTHPGFGPFPGVSSGSFQIPTSGHHFSGNTRYEVVLIATDSDGLQQSTSVFVFPKKVNLTLSTNPIGPSITLDGIPQITPFILNTLIGYQHLLEAPNQSQSGTNYAFSSWSDGGAQQHTIIVPVTDQTYTATFTATPGPTGLLAAYSFNEGNGTTTADISGNGNTATLVGATWIAGKYGQGVAFNGTTSQYVTGTDIDFPSGPFTLSGWFKTSVAGRAKILSKFLSNTNQIYVMTTRSGNVMAGFYDGVDWQEVETAQIYTNDVWHHFAVVVSPSTIELFVDGISKGTDTHDNSLPVNNIVWNMGDSFQGSLDEVKFYSKILTPAEVVNDMNTPL